MKAAKNPVKMQKSKKQVAMSEKSTTLESLKKKGTGKVFKKNLAKNTKNSPLNVKAAKNPAKKQDGILKKSSTSESMKTRTTSSRASLMAAKNPVKMQKSKKQVAMSEKSTTLESLKKKGTGKVFKKNLAKNTKNSPLNVKAAKNP